MLRFHSTQPNHFPFQHDERDLLRGLGRVGASVLPAAASRGPPEEPPCPVLDAVPGGQGQSAVAQAGAAGHLPPPAVLHRGGGQGHAFVSSASPVRYVLHRVHTVLYNPLFSVYIKGFYNLF